MSDDAEDFFDYIASLVAFCSFPGCDWQEHITWGHLASDAEVPTVHDRHRAHFAEAHTAAPPTPETPARPRANRERDISGDD